jgi:subtilase family serine protease
MKRARLGSAAAALFLFCLATAFSLPAQENTQYTIANSKMGFVSKAPDLGPGSVSKQITIYLWLQLRNGQPLSQLVDQLYDPTSANYQKWLTTDQFNANFAPTADDVASVKSFLTAHGLTILSTGERNLYVRAQGSIAQVQSAFGVQIHRFNVNGRIYRANTTSPVMEGPVGALVSRVGGLSDYRLRSHATRTLDPSTGKPVAEARVPTAAPNGAFFSPYCLQGVDVENFTTDGASPKATYVGNAYGAPITNTAAGTLAPCGYQPSDLQTAYNFKALYSAGLDGSKQTVVIVDAWGSPTIATDAAAFTGFYGLAPLNLTVYPLGTACVATDAATLQNCQGWATETSLDVESTHSVATGANIALVEAVSDADDDLNAGILYAVDQHLGNVISNSYGGPESQEGLPSNDPFDATLMIAAAEGITVNFSSGDLGDWTPIEGYMDVSYPASSPYATGVGGTSLFLNKNLTLGFQAGWGDNFTEITNPIDAKGYSTPLVPPDSSPEDGLGFVFGAGGGASGVFRKPSFQAGLPGRFRLVPDISYLADPQTGVEVFCTGSSCFNNDPNNIYFAGVGGTSLACPMFSSLWAITIQKAGHPLGQAARSIYNLPSNAISDIVPEGSPLDAAGIITDGRKPLFEGPYQLVMPETPSPFLSGLAEGSNGAWFVISFGTDTSLSTNRGWDDVTGLGTPNAVQFVNAFAPRH